MKKTIIILTSLILLFGCKSTNNNLLGMYINECSITGVPERIIYIEKDSTYIVLYPSNRPRMGKWYQKDDSIFFKEQYKLHRAKDNSIEKIEIEEQELFWEVEIEGGEKISFDFRPLLEYSYKIKKDYLLETEGCKIRKRRDLDVDSLMIYFYLPLRKDVSE